MDESSTGLPREIIYIILAKYRLLHILTHTYPYTRTLYKATVGILDLCKSSPLRIFPGYSLALVEAHSPPGDFCAKSLDHLSFLRHPHASLVC